MNLKHMPLQKVEEFPQLKNFKLTSMERHFMMETFGLLRMMKQMVELITSKLEINHINPVFHIMHRSGEDPGNIMIKVD